MNNAKGSGIGKVMLAWLIIGVIFYSVIRYIDMTLVDKIIDTLQAL